MFPLFSPKPLFYSSSILYDIYTTTVRYCPIYTCQLLFLRASKFCRGSLFSKFGYSATSTSICLYSNLFLFVWADFIEEKQNRDEASENETLAPLCWDANSLIIDCWTVFRAEIWVNLFVLYAALLRLFTSFYKKTFPTEFLSLSLFLNSS